MGIKELVGIMKGEDRFKGAFSSNAPNGGGAQQSSANQNGSGGDETNLSPTEKMAAGFRKSNA